MLLNKCKTYVSKLLLNNTLMKKTKLIFLIALSLNFYITAIGQNGMTIIPKPNKFSAVRCNDA